MASLVEELDPQHFLRTHRSAIVAAARVRAVEHGPGGVQVVVDGGTRVPVSARFRDAVLQRLQVPST